MADSKPERSRAGIAPLAKCDTSGSSAGCGIASTGCTAQPTLNIATTAAGLVLIAMKPARQDLRRPASQPPRHPWILRSLLPRPQFHSESQLQPHPSRAHRMVSPVMIRRQLNATYSRQAPVGNPQRLRLSELRQPLWQGCFWAMVSGLESSPQTGIQDSILRLASLRAPY